MPAGGYNGHQTSVPPTILPGRSTCWYCFERHRRSLPGAEELGAPLSELPVGVFLPATAAMASLQMPDILRILTGYEPPRFVSCRGDFDLDTCQLTLERVPSEPSCGWCTGTA
jgi:hypothetical protein